MPKVLSTDPLRCNGCKVCELACSIRHDGVSNPARARIRVVDVFGPGDIHVPMSCRQCQDPPCMAACPRKAVYRDELLDRVLIDRTLCIGCRMCVAACPFGAMGFDERAGRPFKCDLCGGTPECVRVCETRSLDYAENSSLPDDRMRRAAETLHMVTGRRSRKREE